MGLNKQKITVEFSIEGYDYDLDPLSLPSQLWDALPIEWKSAGAGDDWWVVQISSTNISAVLDKLQEENDQQRNVIQNMQDDIAGNNRVNELMVERIVDAFTAAGYDVRNDIDQGEVDVLLADLTDAVTSIDSATSIVKDHIRQ